MSLSLNIATGSSAMADAQDVAAALRAVANELGRLPEGEVKEAGIVRDANGNSRGTWELEIEAPEEDGAEDHDEPCDCGHDIQRHTAEEASGLLEPVRGACAVVGCDCVQYAMDEGEALR